MQNGIKIAKMNLDRNRVAMAELVNEINERRLDVLLIQESYVISYRLPLLEILTVFLQNKI